ncbi:thymocyte nuclear protein 1-like [Physella acuta]|uniref:thymocyte nuclear protein 1-like n=1 Tax=Physella acuta TaxID=109671 RepID=UPI0027DBDD85|nr:thymocyte nuclear protein 1-like [Physella acuta]XP_059150701.1 thymocyte nuclear protein 1-like [Physella acuta]XP_059150702.1 thymocyte nuclear protein 1-like [Physella acuta]XP_059150703.1 thymocyte nuclear protein 1-like [Physella acuta]XP_059150704.1 thymocyte nuclear protein 1-like [Physella acuta]
MAPKKGSRSRKISTELQDDSKAPVAKKRKIELQQVPTPVERKNKSVKGQTCATVYSFWLVKSEPESRFEKGIDMKFSLDDLKSSPEQTACWDGVRNYQARNFLRDQMKEGQKVFLYHSNCKEPGIAGVCQVVKAGYPDHTQFDPKDPHYDSSSQKDKPRWFMVDVKYIRHLRRYISLAELKKIHKEHVQDGGPLKNLSLFTRARLSVQPLTKEEWSFIEDLENKEPV